jgi:hypothetical protein
MDPAQFRTMLKPENFCPFDVRTADGESYRVRSPEMGWISPEDDVMLVYDLDQGITLFDVDQVVECVRPIIKDHASEEGRQKDA